MVFSICGGEDSSQMTTDENQTTQNLQNEDINTSENVTSKEQEPTQPQQQEPSQKQEPNQPQQPGEPPNGQPQHQEPPQSQQPNEDSGKKIEKAIGIINAADEAILECISNAFGGDIYKKVVEDLNPDDFEAGVVIECRENPETNQKNDNKKSNENNVDEGQSRNSWYDLNIYSYSPQYNAASLNSYSSFGLNETADILLSGFGLNDSGGKLKINHPVSVSSNGEKLAVTDRFNNRILIWNSIPSQKTAPDIVIGQKNFDTHNSGNGLDELDFPGQVIITPDAKLLVADSDNDRVLVWTNFPQTSGQTADYAIPITNYVSMNNSWPWGVWSDGNKTIVTATVSGTILIWNSFPGSNTPPDVVLTSNQIGTPRSILSNGDYIMIGDENANGEWVDLQPLSTEGQGTTSFPDRKKYMLAQFAIPFGGGFKFSLNKVSNIILEYSIRKTFTDYLDDVSTTYPGENVLRPEFGNESVYMSDPTGNFIAGDQRGNSEKDDWYSYIGITISFKLNDNNKGCDYE